MTMSVRYRHVYLLEVSGFEADGSPTEYSHWMFFFSGPITTEVERAVMNGWVRSFHSDAPEGMNGLLDGSCLD